MKKRAIHLMTASALGMLAVTAPGVALAQGAGTSAEAGNTRHDFRIPAGRLSQSVLALSEQAGVQVVFDSATTGDVSGNVVQGDMSVAQALDRLLAGAPLQWRWLRAGVVTIEATSNAGADDGERVAGTVRIEGVQGSPYFGGAGQAAGVNGINGSRDITATEGTKSFTSGALTIGSKAPQAIKDVPQSVSVLTSERLEQQAVTDYNQALKQLPGISFAQNDNNLDTQFYSRGFPVTSIQIDGGAPLSTDTGYYPQIDLSVYDHVELLRGASVFNGLGDPGGTVNLVRKKPLDRAQFMAEGQVGSWQHYRLVADATAPLALDGKLRGRLVATYQNRHYFYKVVKDDRMVLYGIAELDLTPTTLVTAGVNYTRQNSLPWLFGLPRYQNGKDLRLPRSTSFAFPWNRWNFSTTELFGGIEQKLGGEWVAKLNVTQNRQNTSRKAGYVANSVSPLTGAGPALYGNLVESVSNQLTIQGTVNGAFELFGQRQEFTAGLSRVRNDSGGGQTLYQQLINGSASASAPYQPYPGGPAYYVGSPNGARVPVNVFAFNPNDPRYTEPRNSLPNARSNAYVTTDWVGYATVRFTPVDRLHIVAGLRWTRTEFLSDRDDLCTSIPATAGRPGDPSCFGRRIGDVFDSERFSYAKSHISWPPTASISYDLTPSLTAYAGYTDIYQDQSDKLDADLVPLRPVTGSNYEVGLKWAPNDGRINVAVSAYRIRKRGFADPTDIIPPNVAPGSDCCYTAARNRTQANDGAEFEVTGEVRRGWQLSANYTYNRTRQIGSFFDEGDGLPFLTVQPKHNYKLWTSYDFAAAGATGLLSKFTLSAGVNGQSSAYQLGSACVNFGPPNALGVTRCRSNDVPDSIPFAYTVAGYAVVSGRIDYRMSDRWALSLNFDNILDKTYYQTVGTSPLSGNWYGTPRSAMFTLRGKW